MMNRTALGLGLAVFCVALLVPPYEAVNVYEEAANDLIRVQGVPHRPVEPEITFAVVGVGPADGTWRDARIAGDVWTALLLGVAVLTFGTAHLLRPEP